MKYKKVTLDDVVGFCYYMTDKFTDLLNDTTDELKKAKIEAKLHTYYTILRYIYEDRKEDTR